jgi:uncharacterized Ntn-hydrolase superfamily protein
MTFSIVARCARTGQVGVGAATGMPGVGKLLTYARAGNGAVATQSWINPYLGIDALALLAQPKAAQAGYGRGGTKPRKGYGGKKHKHRGRPSLKKKR